MAFPNPFPNLLPGRIWGLLLQYVERSSCFHSGSWPDSGLKHTQRVSKKGNIVFQEEGPFLCQESGTAPKEGFGGRECDEVALCYLGLDLRSRVIIEATVAGVVLGKPAMRMRWACKRLGVGKAHSYRLRHIAFEKLAKACEEKGIG